MLSPLRFAHLAVSSVRLVHDPDRLEEVFHIADALTTPEVLEQMDVHLRAHPRARAALEERPTLGTIDVDALAALPEGTLGRAFADFVRARNLEPRVLTDKAMDAPSYVGLHLYETHDLWHVVTGFDTDILGELRLQAFVLAQLPWDRLGPVLMGLALLKTSLKGHGDAENPSWTAFEAMVEGWTLGRRSELLFGMRWAEEWERPLQAVRAELGIAA